MSGRAAGEARAGAWADRVVLLCSVAPCSPGGIAPASCSEEFTDREEQSNRMTSPVDPKIKQALRKKPSERTAEVRGLRLLPLGVFFFTFFFVVVVCLFFLGVNLDSDRLLLARCRGSRCWRATRDQAGAHKLLLCRAGLFIYFCFPKLDLWRPTVF